MVNYASSVGVEGDMVYHILLSLQFMLLLCNHKNTIASGKYYRVIKQLKVFKHRKLELIRSSFLIDTQIQDKLLNVDYRHKYLPKLTPSIRFRLLVETDTNVIRSILW